MDHHLASSKGWGRLIQLVPPPRRQRHFGAPPGGYCKLLSTLVMADTGSVLQGSVGGHVKSRCEDPARRWRQDVVVQDVTKQLNIAQAAVDSCKAAKKAAQEGPERDMRQPRQKVLAGAAFARDKNDELLFHRHFREWTAQARPVRSKRSGLRSAP